MKYFPRNSQTVTGTHNKAIADIFHTISNEIIQNALNTLHQWIINLSFSPQRSNNNKLQLMTAKSQATRSRRLVWAHNANCNNNNKNYVHLYTRKQLSEEF